MPLPLWTPEQAKLLHKLWTQGLSASQISDRIPGKTRNSIVGYVGRMRMKEGKDVWAARSVGSHAKKPRKRTLTPTPPPTPTITLPTLKERIVDARLDIANKIFELRKEAKELTSLGNDVGPPLNIPLVDAQHHHCRWIDDPRDGFCGRTRVLGSSFCITHKAIAYQPLVRRTRANVR